MDSPCNVLHHYLLSAVGMLYWGVAYQHASLRLDQNCACGDMQPCAFISNPVSISVVHEPRMCRLHGCRWRTYLQPGVMHASTVPFSDWEKAVVKEVRQAEHELPDGFYSW